MIPELYVAWHAGKSKWKKDNLGRGWVLGETLLAGIGQGYFQTTPIQLCLMTAQLANEG